jgi:hypothetical protein
MEKETVKVKVKVKATVREMAKKTVTEKATGRT